MARSQSRPRGRPSKSPARTKKATPKSEPKKAASRSRSASRGRPAAAKTPKTEPKKVTKVATPKSEKKSPSRSRSRSRATTATAKTPAAKSPSKSPARTPAVRKTPAVPLKKTPLPQAPTNTPYQRPSRSVKKEAAGVASAKILRPDSYSPARLQVRSPSRQRPLLTRWKTSVVGQAKASIRYFQKYRNDILISIGLILFISFIGFMIFKEDNPVKKFAAAKAQWAQKQAQQAYVKAVDYWNTKA